MDEHQRRVWSQMVDEVNAYQAGRIDLGSLMWNLKGLLGASDLHGMRLVLEFWDHFAEIDMEFELRSEAWAPGGLASDERLREALETFKTWVVQVMANTTKERE